jgi:hypothetical protein
MLQQIIDRRLAGKNKSIGNRERFLRRFRDQIREAVRKAVGDRSIKDVEHGTDISLPKRDISEPAFGHGTGGAREIVHPGNREYVRGDHAPDRCRLTGLEPGDRLRAAGVGGHALTLWARVLADLAQGGGDRGAEATGGRGRQVRDETEPGAAHLFHREHDAGLTHAAGIAVVAQRHRP